MDVQIRELIAIGASVATNCQPCLNYHVGKAKEVGADEKDITGAIEVAKAVRKGAMSKMDQFTLTLLTPAEAAAAVPEKGCGCS